MTPFVTNYQSFVVHNNQIMTITNPKKSTRVLGMTGEDLAADYLRRLGYQIIARNYHARMGELDIVAQKEGVWHFVEVKTRSSAQHGQPYEAVRPWKVQHLKKAAWLYLLRHGHSTSQRMVFDVISILKMGTDYNITFYQNVSMY